MIDLQTAMNLAGSHGEGHPMHALRQEILRLEADLTAANERAGRAIKHLQNKRARGKLSQCEDQVLSVLTPAEAARKEPK